MKNREIDKLVSQEVKSRINRLMDSNVQELVSLPSENIEDLRIGNKTLKLCTYRDLLQDEEFLIIVQCKNEIFLGYGHMFAEGIVVSSDGKKRPAEQELMWEYV